MGLDGVGRVKGGGSFLLLALLANLPFQDFEKSQHIRKDVTPAW